MKFRLKQAGLLRNPKEEKLDINITFAWTVLSRLRCPACYVGRTQDGSYEYLASQPVTGEYLATGRGPSIELSMCEAALAACSHRNKPEEFTGDMKPSVPDINPERRIK